MKEEIKKDLEELKKEIKEEVSFKGEEKIDQPEKEKLTLERIEGLVERLEETTQQEKTLVSKFQKSEKLRILKNPWMIGILVSLILLIVGVYTLLNLLFYQKKTLSKNQNIKIGIEERLEETKKPQISNQTKPETNTTFPFQRTELVLTKTEEKSVNYPYKLELKNFIIPLGVKDFLNVDVIFYFDNQTNMKEIIESEILYREAVYYYFQKISTTVWLDPNKRKEVKEKLKTYIQEKKITPVPKEIDLEGVVFRG